MTQCATCRNTAQEGFAYCGFCEQKIERNQRIEELQKRIQLTTDLSALIEVVDFLLEEAKVLM